MPGRSSPLAARGGGPAALERSRSGNGGHVWIFFAEPVPAVLARRLGSHFLTEATEIRPDLGFKSYDRFFPSQDTVPEGGFGNLIALPVQGEPRERGNSVFLDGGSRRTKINGPRSPPPVDGSVDGKAWCVP